MLNFYLLVSIILLAVPITAAPVYPYAITAPLEPRAPQCTIDICYTEALIVDQLDAKACPSILSTTEYLYCTTTVTAAASTVTATALVTTYTSSTSTALQTTTVVSDVTVTSTSILTTSEKETTIETDLITTTQSTTSTTSTTFTTTVTTEAIPPNVAGPNGPSVGLSERAPAFNILYRTKSLYGRSGSGVATATSSCISSYTSPTSVPNLASQCNAKGFASACRCFGHKPSTTTVQQGSTTTITPTTTVTTEITATVISAFTTSSTATLSQTSTITASTSLTTTVIVPTTSTTTSTATISANATITTAITTVSETAVVEQHSMPFTLRADNAVISYWSGLYLHLDFDNTFSLFWLDRTGALTTDLNKGSGSWAAHVANTGNDIIWMNGDGNPPNALYCTIQDFLHTSGAFVCYAGGYGSLQRVFSTCGDGILRISDTVPDGCTLITLTAELFE